MYILGYFFNFFSKTINNLLRDTVNILYKIKKKMKENIEEREKNYNYDFITIY